MKFISIVLLVAIFFRHNTYLWISSWLSLSHAEVFYILGGALEVVLAGVLFTIILVAEKTVWRLLALGALLMGVVEGIQISACRLLITDIKQAPMGVDLCDYVTGLPVYATTISLYLLILCYVWGRYARRT